MLLRIAMKSKGDFIPALKNSVLLLKTPTDILLFNSCTICGLPAHSRNDQVSLNKVCFFGTEVILLPILSLSYGFL